MGSIPDRRTNVSSTQQSMSSSPIETDLLIVGAGPAGASLACFLARYGLSGLMISSAPGTADTPRAHMNNMSAMETLRDIGLWEECARLGNTDAAIKHYRWCETMAGEEYARTWSWGNGPRKSDYEMASPCWPMDLPQNLLEPILVKYATTNGFKVRFDTKFLGFREEEGKGGEKRNIVCQVQDRVIGSQYEIRTKYLFGADGGRSVIAQQLDLPMTVFPGGGLAFNILVRADLSHMMAHRKGNLHWCVRLERDYPFMCVGRMVKPWHEWMFVIFPKGPDSPNPERSDEEWKALVEDVIGDPSVEVELLGVSKWLINETSADVISRGNIFCLGDAIHRHPPTLGLGSNTCIQDSFNLSWKIALVLKGLATPSLLSTYQTERQPVAAQLVKASNDMLRKHILVWQSLGVQPYRSSDEERKKGWIQLREASKAGKEARKILKERLDDMQHETHALGIEKAQLYSGHGIFSKDEDAPFQPGPQEAQDSVLYYDPCTYPGRRLPHVWLGSPIPGPLISTLDITGKGRFTILTGNGGRAWVSAADAVEKTIGITIKVILIGRGQDWEDVYLDWEDKRGVEEDGCVLVRPDFFVAWRAKEGGDETKRLQWVVRSILGLDG